MPKSRLIPNDGAESSRRGEKLRKHRSRLIRGSVGWLKGRFPFGRASVEDALPMTRGRIRWQTEGDGACKCQGEEGKDLSKGWREKGISGWLRRYNEFFSNSIIVARSNYSRRSEE